MQFNLNFTCSAYLFDLDSYRIGTEKLVEVRTDLGVNVPISVVASLVPNMYKKDYYLIVSEALAFKADVFMLSCDASVTVKGDKPFNPFLDLITIVERDKSTDAILNVSFKYELNEDKVLEAWEAAGFPSEWDLSAE